MTSRPAVSGVETAIVMAEPERVSLWELARVFLLIGLVGFGGGMAIVALIRQICVERRRWLSDEEFAHGVALSQFLGAFAVNTTTFVGYRLRGVSGAIVAVVAFLTPGVVLIIVLAGLYFRYQELKLLQGALHGISPVVVAIILAAAVNMGRSSMKSRETWLLAASTFLAYMFLPVPTVVIIAAVALYGVAKWLVVRGNGT